MPLTVLGLDALASNTTIATAAQGVVGRFAGDLVSGLEVFFGFLFGPDPLRKWIWEDPKWNLGITMWASVWAYWLYSEVERRYEVVGEFHWTAIMVLGLNLAALSMIQIMGAAGFFGLLAMTYANIRMTKKLFPMEKTIGESFDAGNIYEDLKCPMMQVMTIFLGQSILTLFLIYSVYHNYAENSEGTTYTFWAAAYIAVQMSGFFKRGRDSQLGVTCDVEWWRALKLRSRTTKFKLQGRGEWFEKSEREMYARAFMAFTVNTFYRDIIAFITPVLCMQSSDGVDFVQNCFALSYITTLDDVGDAKTFEVAERERSSNDGAGQAEDPLLES